MANPGNPKPLAAVFLALVLTALCLAADEKREASRAQSVEGPEYSGGTETLAIVNP